MCDKRELREKYLARRATLKSAERDSAIAHAFLASPYANRDSFFIYCAVRTEVATAEIIAALLARGKRVCLPRIEGKDMLALPYGRLKPGALGIPEPFCGADEPCEVALVPLIAVDREGYRLGYGGGYYDRYFARRPETLRVGLAYAGQAVEKLPHFDYDVPLDAVVSEDGVREIAKNLTRHS